MKLRCMIAGILLLLASPQNSLCENLVFTQGEEAGTYKFDTGIVRGIFNGEKNSQGFISLIHNATDKELAHTPGLLSFYRLLSANTRWPTDFRDRNRTAQLTDQGALLIHWPSEEGSPVQVSAIFNWRSPDTLDLGIEMIPSIDLRDGELFLSSYLDLSMKAYVYADATFMEPGQPAFLPGDVRGVDDLLYGAYLAFPRNGAAAQKLYDGRWERGLHPVHWAVTRFYKQPMLLKQDTDGLGVLIMARPQDCFSVEMSYNREPPDGIAGHSSAYLSLFGEDLHAGEPRRTTVRMKVGEKIDEVKALEWFEEFIPIHD